MSLLSCFCIVVGMYTPYNVCMIRNARIRDMLQCLLHLVNMCYSAMVRYTYRFEHDSSSVFRDVFETSQFWLLSNDIALLLNTIRVY